MSEEQSVSNGEAVGSPSPGAMNDVAALVILFDVVNAGLGGLYVSTQSVAVTVVAAGLVARLGRYVTLGRGHQR
jgi:hypothetical protein